MCDVSYYWLGVELEFEERFVIKAQTSYAEQAGTSVNPKLMMHIIVVSPQGPINANSRTLRCGDTLRRKCCVAFGRERAAGDRA